MRRSAALALLVLLLPRAVSSADTAETVTFRFSPPDGITYLENVVVSRTLEGGPTRQTDLQKGQARVRIDKLPDGWTVTGTPVSMTMETDGKPVESPLVTALQGAVAVYRLDPQGNLVSVQGYEGLLDKVSKDLKPEEAQALAKILDPESILARERTEWNARIGSFAGKTFELGSSWVTEAPLALPSGGEVQLRTHTELAERTRCGGDRDCVRLRFRYDSDEPRVTGTGERVVDPSTLLIYSEAVERVLPVQDGVVLREKREHSYDYSPAAGVR